MENPIKMDDLGGKPHDFWKHPFKDEALVGPNQPISRTLRFPLTAKPKNGPLGVSELLSRISLSLFWGVTHKLGLFFNSGKKHSPRLVWRIQPKKKTVFCPTKSTPKTRCRQADIVLIMGWSVRVFYWEFIAEAVLAVFCFFFAWKKNYMMNFCLGWRSSII